MINRKILLMILFSFSAHLALAAVIVYTPYEVIGNRIASHHETVIWGYVEGGEKSAKDGNRDSAIYPVREDKMKLEGNSIPPGQLIRVDTDETPMSRRLTKADENVIPAQAGIQTDGMILDSYFRRNDSQLGAFSSENEISTPALIVAENGLAEGQKGETGITIVQSDGSDAGDKNICNTSEDCESVTLSNGKQGSNSFDMHALTEHVRKEIERNKYYPELAKLKGIEGTVYINFYIGQDGTPSSISVARSSGSRILDNAGIKTIGMVGKFSNLHKDLRELDIVVPITYKLVNTDKQ